MLPRIYLSVVVALLAAVAHAQPLPPNLALHCAYTLSPAPNYDLCTDPNDTTQLTDGVFTGESFWTRSTTVGWAVGVPVQITVDLGGDEPISGAAFSTAAGAGGVEWPWSIVVLTSTDGKSWQRAGDLARLDRQPPATQLTNHILRATSLQTHGRYVRFLVGKQAYIFADEVEVYRGEDAWRQQPPAGREVTDMEAAGLEAQGVNAMLERLRADVHEAQAAIQASKLPEADKLKLLDSAAQLAAEIEMLPNELPAGFRTIMPFSDLQARIFALHAPVNRAAGLPPLTVWASSRWDVLFPTQAPAAPNPPTALRVDMLRNEHRAATFNLTNSTDQPMTVGVNLRGLPGGDNPAWISVREVQFTETYSRRVIAAGLPLAKRIGEGYAVTIPAGMTKQVWLALHPTDVPPGAATGTIALAAPGQPPVSVPLTVHLSPVRFPARPSIAIGGWDYTDGPKSAFDAGNVDQKAYIAKLREYWVDMPWGGGQPAGAEFAADGHMTKPPSFAPWDQWLAKWPDARHFGVFGLGKDFANADPKDPRTRRMVADFLTAWVAHLKTQGLKPAQLCLLVDDEPHSPEMDAGYVAWAQLVRDANTGVTIWVDPCHDDPLKADPRVYALSDVLCPSAARFVGSPQSYRDFFVNQQQEAGKELQFYSCVNGKHLDPITYHRGQFWLAIKYGAKGSSYWAFGDEGRAGSSYRAYTSPGHMFSPLFLDPETGITDGKHMEALREGAEDFELFALLRQRVADLKAKGVNAPALAQAEKLLTDGPDRVCAEITIDRLDWIVPKERGTMDEVRVEALRALEALGQ